MPDLYDLLTPLARAGITWLSRRSQPLIDGRLDLPGLQAPLEIIRDRWGIPHIYADNLHDLFYGQGFVHAQDRLWQMELNRRTGQGTLSEMFGEQALETDRLIRTLGFNRLGRQDWVNAPDPVKDILIAYTKGVNAFLSSPEVKLPVEFSLLRHEPERWSPQDILVFARVMIWQLSHAWYSEIVRAKIARTAGEEHAQELEIHYPQTNPIILPNGIEFNRIDAAGRLRKASGPFLFQGKGSNAWAVSGRKSASGKPFLCNDLHLPLRLPSLWYEVHLHGGGLQVAGASVPGLPMVLVGHNDRVAWGMTLAFTDCEDLFVEQFDPESPMQYQFQNEWEEAQEIVEPIRVKGRSEPHKERVVITRHGPVVSDVIGYPEQRVTLNSMALRPCLAVQGWLMLNQAKGWDEFVDALRLIDAPQLSVTYADVEGNIGYWLTGRVPVRKNGCGDVPVPGWSGEYEWTGEVPFDEMPHLFNPKAGYVLNCNNKIVPDDYPHFLGNVWMNGYRARVIEKRLKSRKKNTVDDFRSLQMDVTSLPGQEFVALLKGIDETDPDVRLALERLRSWDGQLTPDSVGGALFEAAKAAAVRSLLEPCLGQELSASATGQGFHPLLFSAHEYYGNDTVTLLRLLSQPGSWWAEQAGGREALLTHSLRQAVEWLRSELGPQVDEWQWGKIHQVKFEHAMSLRRPLDGVFNRGPFPIGGDTDTPCQTASLPNGPNDNNLSSPSFRMILDLGDLGSSLAIYPCGQSGQLGSLHYDDLIQPWLQGEYHPMLWTREQVEAGTSERLLLQPRAPIEQ